MAKKYMVMLRLREELPACEAITAFHPEASYHKVRFRLSEFAFPVKMVAAEGIVNLILYGKRGRF